MLAIVKNLSIAAIFGGYETILVLAIVLILLGTRHLPGIARGFRRGFYEFRRASKDLAQEIDQEASDAGRSLGGIYGKPAAEALTTDNQTAELYEPAVLEKTEKPNSTGLRSLLRIALAKCKRFILRACTFVRSH
jgi:Sec-independent protein translocase protein TatA